MNGSSCVNYQGDPIRTPSNRSRSRSSYESSRDRYQERDFGRYGRTQDRSRSGRHAAGNGRGRKRNAKHGSGRGYRPEPGPSVPQRILSVIFRVLVAIKNIILFLVEAVFRGLRTIASYPIGKFVLLIAALALIAVIVLTVLNRCSAPAPATDQNANANTEQANTTTTVVDYTPDTSMLASLQLSSADATPFTLNLSRTDVVPSVPEDKMQAINNATAVLTDQEITVGYVFLNLKTGMGLARDVDTEVYAASSIKGPYAAYLCSLMDQGQISRDTRCKNTWRLDEGSGRDQSTYSVESLIEDMVVWSDNDALRFVRSSYDDLGFEQWLADMSADTNIAHDGAWFAHYTARDSAIMWMSIYQYLTQAETNENAAWLAELMSSTEVSFIRNGTEIEGMEATVYNKGGWCIGSSDDYDSVCDSAVVYDGNVPYLLVIMTSAPDGSNNEEAVSNIAAALLDARYSFDDRTMAALTSIDKAKTAVNQSFQALDSAFETAE